jgi:DNA-binding FadR family transcriptional regulator
VDSTAAEEVIARASQALTRASHGQGAMQGAMENHVKERKSSLRWQRLGELVAAQLRNQILSGELPEGTMLPKEEKLREMYPVSKPSIREGLHILEAEGLISVRRGNQGGAIVHPPTATNVAYALAMVLRTKSVKIEDVALALREVEPACAALCAGRPDRAKKVVPRLEAIHKSGLSKIDDLVSVIAISRSFHETLVELCGNESLIVIVGALEAIWSTHETTWSRTGSARKVPLAERRQALNGHGKVIEAIAKGDASAARRLAATHLEAVQPYPTPPQNEIAPDLIKSYLATLT